MYYEKEDQARAGLRALLAALEKDRPDVTVLASRVTLAPYYGWEPEIYVPRGTDVCMIGTARIRFAVPEAPTLPVSAWPEGDKPVASSKAGASGGGVKGRPSRGATLRVWEIADEVLEEVGSVDRALIIQRCVDAGVNKSTASTQFSRWQKQIDTGAGGTDA